MRLARIIAVDTAVPHRLCTHCSQLSGVTFNYFYCSSVSLSLQYVTVLSGLTVERKEEVQWEGKIIPVVAVLLPRDPSTARVSKEIWSGRKPLSLRNSNKISSMPRKSQTVPVVATLSHQVILNHRGKRKWRLIKSK